MSLKVLETWLGVMALHVSLRTAATYSMCKL